MLQTRLVSCWTTLRSTLDGVQTVASTNVHKGLAAHCIYNLFFHPLSSFPGPALWTSSRLPFVYSLQSGTLQARIKNFHDVYGEVVRVAPDELSFIKASAWRDIYSGGLGNKGFTKNAVISGAQGFPDIINANDVDHTRIRKLLQDTFSAQALRDREHILQTYVSLLIGKLREKAKTDTDTARQDYNEGSTIVNIVKWYSFTTFDITGELSLSESFGCLENEIYDPWIAMIFSHLKASSLAIGFRFYSPLDKILVSCLPKHLLQEKDRFLRLAKDKVRRRMARDHPTSKHGDFMSTALIDTANDRMSIDEIDGTFTTLIVAGSETTATSLSGVTNYLCKNPRVLRQLVKEVREAFEYESDIKLSALSRLPYLTAVLHEGLRMCPPVPCGLTRIVPSCGAWIGGYWVPGGVCTPSTPRPIFDRPADINSTYQVGAAVTQWAAYRSKHNFLYPDEFVPERWLGNSSSAPFDGDSRAVLQPFQVGGRNCLGQNIAWAEMRLIIGRMVWNFDISPACDLDWAKQQTFMLWQKEPFYVCLKPVDRGECE